ncbi:hypothetical protein SCLCIDRAFT_33066 [Scleroderma citrinum Foug A]|uniref:Uncharacterized protein n=1 Tax=Scleroderma citrinum Foug A TaxID=1036808 RepID=A0A0C3D756_9AGAM|nr:hypothetical protein SCLCIDRAFT_33066 [Scleroderma citrinum Foug A]
MLIPLTQEMDLTSGTPSNVDLEHTVLGTLWTADLNTVTKSTINAAVNCMLLGQL